MDPKVIEKGFWRAVSSIVVAPFIHTYLQSFAAVNKFDHGVGNILLSHITLTQTRQSSLEKPEPWFVHHTNQSATSP
jgi:hypothetical protein